ncbi:MAG: phosphate acyltransferase PlsX [Oscillospiraceae bacterium]|nr:phosphate acyltransferase PlsX [Oscillospiraceae bacterium]
MKIVIDGFGGDNAPDEVLKGAALAVKELGIDIAVTGDEKTLEERMKALGVSHDRIEIIPAEGVITTEDPPKSVIKEKAGTSMGKALYYLSDGNADAFISAGSTAAIVVGGTMVEKRIKGVKRTALVPLMPCYGGGRYSVIDGGANLECRPEMLQQFAVLGSIFMEKTMGIEKPRVGLLNIGTEEEKGRELEHEACKLLRNTPSINFIGYVEGRDAPVGGVDVLVTDGFTGNVFLKACEGMGILMKKSLKDMFFANLKTKMGALMVKKQLTTISKHLDYKTIGGSPLLGTAKPVFKAHGSSDAIAFLGAFRQAKMFVEKNAIEEMTSAIAALGVKDEDQNV